MIFEAYYWLRHNTPEVRIREVWDCGVGGKRGLIYSESDRFNDGRKLGEMGTIEPGVEWALKVSLHSS